MKKAKIIKIFPAPHVEVRLHISKEMEEDFKKCDRCALASQKCWDCSWHNVKVFGVFCCVTLFMEEIRRQLGLEQE